jgi:hypothetical protein
MHTAFDDGAFDVQYFFEQLVLRDESPEFYPPSCCRESCIFHRLAPIDVASAHQAGSSILMLMA